MAKVKKAIKKVTGVVAPSAKWTTRLIEKTQKRLAKKKTPQAKTVRTKAIEKGLKAAGLTAADLERLTGQRMKKTFSK